MFHSVPERNRQNLLVICIHCIRLTFFVVLGLGQAQCLGNLRPADPQQSNHTTDESSRSSENQLND